VQNGCCFVTEILALCEHTKMVVHLDDLLCRRLSLLILAKLSPDGMRRVAGIVTPVLGWNQRRIELECRF